MPAKNASLYIEPAVKSVQSSSFQDWELIICEDYSDDGTFEKAFSLAEKDSRIKVIKNEGKGKVCGLNTAFKYSTGDFIKCIDSDDTISKLFFSFLPEITTVQASCHDYYIVDERLKKQAVYSMNRRFFSLSFETVVKEMLSLPRAVWTVSRNIAQKIFPMPVSLPYEDVWFSFIIKKHADKIKYIPKPLYNYRQHSTQTFGGVLNYSKETIRFRANRIVQLLDVINREKGKLGESVGEWTEHHRKYYRMMSESEVSLKDIIDSDLPLRKKIEMTLYKRLNWIIPLLKKIQWKYDKLFA